MQKTIGNEDLAFLFEEDRFSTKRGKRNRFKNTTPESIELSKLYDSIEVQVPKNGKVVSAKYEGSNPESFIFEVVGYKDFIRVDNKINEAKYLKNTNIGDTIDVLILDVNEKNYLIKGSISTLYESRAHANMKALDENASVTAYVKALSPAGYEMEIYNGGVTLPGFMPNTLAGINKLVDPTSIIGDTFEVSIESYSDKEGTYIVSRRKYLRSLIPAATEQLQSGQVYMGHVTGTANFGVFVEFNECLTGMIHKANVHPEWQDRLDEIKPGFEIEFYVKEIVKNPKYEDKIILTQILRETLWDNIKIGQVIQGKVKDTKQFGTLIILDDETIGLVHTSEMEKSGKKLTPGQEIKVKVLSLERSQRKIFLTLA